MKGKFYLLEYAPNKIAFVYKEEEGKIYFYVFLNEGKGMHAVTHTVNTGSKGDFKKAKIDPDLKIHLTKLIKIAAN